MKGRREKGKNMKIGIDCRTILDVEGGEKAGVGHYTYFLVENLLKIDQEDQFILFFDPKVGDAGKFKRPNSLIKFFPFNQYRKFLPVAYSHFLVSAFISRENIDVFHSPASTIPLAFPGKSVVTIHDLAIYRRKEWFPKGQGFATKVSVPKSIEKARKIIAVSKSTGQDLGEIFNLSKSKIVVVYNGVEAGEGVGVEEINKLKKKFNLDDYVLFVGTIEPRKNLVGLIDAFEMMVRGGRLKSLKLVIAGSRGWGYEEVFAEVKKLRLQGQVVFTDYVSAKEKAALLTGAKMFVFPSFYEGFGLSILEAMRAGTPVITSNLTSMPEVAGEAALLINPRKVEEIKRAMERVMKDPALAKKLVEKGTQQVKKFSWKKCAQETLKVYQEVDAES